MGSESTTRCLSIFLLFSLLSLIIRVRVYTPLQSSPLSLLPTFPSLFPFRSSSTRRTVCSRGRPDERRKGEKKGTRGRRRWSSGGEGWREGEVWESLRASGSTARSRNNAIGSKRVSRVHALFVPTRVHMYTFLASLKAGLCKCRAPTIMMMMTTMRCSRELVKTRARA